MRTFIGILLILAGVVLGLYLGIWVMLIGGILQLVKGLTVDPVVAKDIAYGVARVLLAGVTGWVTFIVCLLLAKLFLKD